MSIQKVVGYIVSIGLFFFALIYALAATYEPTRLIVSLILFVAGFGILYFIREEKPRDLVQKFEVTGRIKAHEVRCPNCSASLEMDKVRVVGGTPLANCSYCGHTFELVEEPKW